MDDGIQMMQSPRKKRTFSPVMKGGYQFQAEEEKQLNPLKKEEQCPQCGFVGEPTVREMMGCVGWSWVVFLFFATLIFFFLPFLISGCKDKITQCSRCGHLLDRQFALCL